MSETLQLVWNTNVKSQVFAVVVSYQSALQNYGEDLWEFCMLDLEDGMQPALQTARLFFDCGYWVDLLFVQWRKRSHEDVMIDDWFWLVQWSASLEYANQTAL